MHIFVYEHISAGGLGSDAPASLLREGRAMLDAVTDDFGRVPGVSVATLRHDSEFRTLARTADATLVIAPEFDDLLLTRSRWVLEEGGRLLGSLPAAVELCADKWTLDRHWRQYGVPTPLTALMGEAVAFPRVCKPRHGAGSQATYLVRTAAEWPAIERQARSEWSGDLLVQQYVSGVAASVAFLVGPDVCVPLLPAAQFLSDDGRFHYRGGRLPLPADLAERAVRLGRAALDGIDGLQGYVGVDLVLGEEDYAVEINPRLTTSYIGLRQRCRGNLADAWLRVRGGDNVSLEWEERSGEWSVGE